MGTSRRIPGVKRCRAVPEKVWSEKPKSGKRHNAKTNLELHSIVLLYRTPLCRPVYRSLWMPWEGHLPLAAFIIGRLCVAEYCVDDNEQNHDDRPFKNICVYCIV